MFSYNGGYKDEDDLMFDMDGDERDAKRGLGYKSSECLCCTQSGTAVLQCCIVLFSSATHIAASNFNETI